MPRSPWALGPIALVLCAACDEGGEPGRCIPLPEGAELRRAPLDDREVQGSTMQGSTMQGTSAQGHENQGENWQGSEWQGPDLAELNGARLHLAGTSTRVAIVDGRLVAGDTPVRDADVTVTSPTGREFLAHLTTLESAAGDRIVVRVDDVAVCAAGQEGVFVPGSWDTSAAHAIVDDELTYSCMDGVIAKCVDWGYAPWTVGTDVHQSCTRLARADYCGDGNPWTIDGTVIDVYDDLGVQVPTGDPQLEFEAGWSVDGAVCVHETRWQIRDADGRAVQAACLDDLPTCTSLAEAQAFGTTLVNAATPTAIDACE